MRDSRPRSNMCRLGEVVAATALMALMAPPACAGTMYKSTGSDGRTIYSDAPPRDVRSTRRIDFESLPSTPVPEYILRFREEMLSKADRRREAERIAASSSVMLFIAQWCKYCTQARAYLASRKLAYREIDIDTEAGKQAFAVLGGGGIPLLIRDGKATRGFQREAYDALFADLDAGARTPAGKQP